MRKSTSSSTSRLIRAGFATGAVASAIVATAAAPALAAAGTLALSAPGGASGGGNTVIATFATAPTSPTPVTFNASTTAQFVAPASATTAITCPLTYAAPGTTSGGALTVAGAALKVLAPTKLGVTVPAGVIHPMPIGSTAASSRYVLCVYGGSTAGTSPLVASAPYTVGAKPTIAASGYISPASGPALGGTQITVTGTNFVANTVALPNNTTATLGGLPLKDINVAAGGTSFTATTPPHAAGASQLLTITTPGGTVSTVAATTTKATLFTYTNGIVISPNTAANSKTTATDIDILGVGFTTLDFTGSGGPTPSSADSHVYLTKTQYNATGTTGSGLTGVKTSFPITECTSVLVVSDTELLCSLLLTRSLAAAGTYATARTVSIATVSGSATITSDTGTFTSGDVGSSITVPSNTQIATGQTILTVTSPTTATISATALATSVAVDATITGTARVTTSDSIITTTGASATTITGSTGDFLAADIGKVIVGTGIPANTTITAIAAGGASATISNAATIAGTATDVDITSGVPVPNDTYTVTVVSKGTVGANLSDPTNYLQSIVSSGSTFTVADY